MHLRNEAPTVEETQDAVEKTFFENQEYEAAKAFIIYRYQHQNMRESKAIFSNIDLVEDYISHRITSYNVCYTKLLRIDDHTHGRT